MVRIKCRFIPEKWVNDQAYPVNLPESFNHEWMMDVDTLPKEYSEESDALRESPNAPQWVKDWDGPFEVLVTVQE